MAGQVNRSKAGNVLGVNCDTAYISMRQAQRYYIQNSTGGGGAGVTAQTTFSATTPTLLIDSGTTNRIVPASLTLSQSGTVAGGTIFLQFALDNIVRYSSGGTSVTPALTSFVFTAASNAAQVRENATALAAGSPRYFLPISWTQAVGTSITLNFHEGFEISTSQSLLFYAWAATTAPTLLYHWEWIEENA